MKRIIHNYLYNFGYQLITLMLPFITVPYITRVLGPENLGIESFTMSIVSIFIAFATAGTTVYSTRVVANLRDKEEELLQAVYNILAFRSSLACVVILVYLFTLYNSEYRFFLLLQLAYILANTLFDFTWYFIGKERFKEITLRNLTVKIIGFLLMLLLVKDENDLYLFILINGLTMLVPNLYFMIIFFNEIGKPSWIYFSLAYFKSLVKSLLPFFLMALMIQFYVNIDKLIMEYKNLTYELGIYSQMTKTFNVFLAPVTAIGTILMPYASNLNYNQNQKDMNNVLLVSTNIIFLLAIPIFFGILSISSQFVSLYFGEDFLEYLNVFKVGCFLIISGSISNIVIQQVILPSMNEKIYLKGLLYATLIRIVLILTLINSMKIYAVILAYIISEAVILFFCIYTAKKTVNIIPVLFSRNNFKIFAAGILMFLILYSLEFEMVWEILIGMTIYVIILLFFKESMSKRLLLFLRIYTKLKREVIDIYSLSLLTSTVHHCNNI